MSATPNAATRYECRNNLSVLCSRGDRTPTRKTCAYCGGALVVHRGLWGVFVWKQDNRYLAANAISTHSSKGRAEKAAGTEYVVRWLQGSYPAVPQVSNDA